jgi:VanZ family protein
MKQKKRMDIITVRCTICIILSVIWMAVIFSFSAKTADESSAESNAIGMLVGEIVIPDFEEWSTEEQQSFTKDWDYPIRKAAHMTEYAVLGIFLLGALAGKQSVRHKVTAVRAFAVAVLYAASDEFHQYFVPGRACRIYDVGFDSAGALIGILIGTTFAVWYNKKRTDERNTGVPNQDTRA